jgi:tetratricopeptide (TPR) repeat protein
MKLFGIKLFGKDVTLYNKGESLAGLKKYEDAIECFNKAIEIDPKYKTAWNNKGNVLNELNRHDDAVECYNKVAEIDKNCEQEKEAYMNKQNT